LLMSSKMKILEKLNQAVVPNSLYLNDNQITKENLNKLLREKQLNFPLIVKPDIGERGLLVEKMNSLEQLCYYLQQNKIAYIIQEFVELPNEVGIFFHKDPESSLISISSVCLKRFLSLIGDGQSSFGELLESHFHGKYQRERMQVLHQDKYDEIIPLDEKILLEPIGNHSRGTAFYDGSHLIDDKLIDLVLHILDGNEDINYGRFDIKYDSIEGLKNLNNFKVIELNGCASEPTHIYDRKFSALEKYRIFFSHFRIMFKISQKQSRIGHKPLSAFVVFKLIRDYFKYMRGINPNVKLI